jgi:ABC-type glycerol-3-phosphate transport system permease component
MSSSCAAFSAVEAARVDGASEFRVIWRVCLRLPGPDFIAVLLFSLLAVIPLIIAFLVLPRYSQTGLAAGGVKGRAGFHRPT